MDWKFWKKNTPAQDSGNSNIEKVSRPKEMMEQLGMYLVTKLRKSPDWVWSLKVVERTHTTSKHVSEFRVYDPAMTIERDVVIKNFYSLDQNPELILFEGSMDKKNKQIQVQEKGAGVVDTKAA